MIDLISRQAALDALGNIDCSDGVGFSALKYDAINDAVTAIKALPPAQPEPEEFEWCHTCREYDQEKHCCHRWTKVIRKTVDDMKAAQPGWIPCSERLPENSDFYYVTVEWWDGRKFTEECSYNHEYKEWNDGEYDYYGAVVIAWMEKPEPWRGGQDG